MVIELHRRDARGKWNEISFDGLYYRKFEVMIQMRDAYASRRSGHRFRHGGHLRYTRAPGRHPGDSRVDKIR